MDQPVPVRRPTAGPSNESWVVVAAIAALGAAFAAAYLDAAPTGTSAADAIWRAAIVALLTISATRASTAALVVASAVVAAGSVGPALVGGLVALGVSVACHVRRRRWPILDAAVGALIGIVSMELSIGWFVGASTLVGTVALLIVTLSAWRACAGTARRRIGLALAVVVAFVAIAGAGAAIGGWMSRDDLLAGVDAVEAGVSATGAGDAATAHLSFVAATGHFESAGVALDAPWMWPSRVVPGLAQNVEVAQRVATAGVTLAGEAAEHLSDLDDERLRRPDGGVDLVELEALREPVASASAALADVDATVADLASPWLVPPIADRLAEVALRIDELVGEAEIAGLAVNHLPALLGADAPRRYLILLGNPAELRDQGGHLGNWAELNVADGQFDLVTVGVPSELAIDPLLAGSLDLSSYPPAMIDTKPALFPQNWGTSIDLPTVARLSADLYAARTGRGIDGVMYADPSAFAAMLAITGPVPVPGLPMEIDSSNAESFLTEQQYVLYPSPAAAGEGVTQLVGDVFDRLTAAQLPGPRLLSDLFWPEVSAGHLQFFSLHGDDAPLPVRLGLDGAVGAPDGGDVLAIVGRNAGQNKMDNYLRRDTAVDLEWDPDTGSVTERVRVELVNDPRITGSNRDLLGNDVGLPPGTNLTDLAVLTPHVLRRATVDGVEVPVSPSSDAGLSRYSVRVTLDPGDEAEVVFELDGRVEPGDEYRWSFVGQTMLEDQPVEVSMHASDGEITEGDGMLAAGSEALATIDGSADTRVRFRVR